MRLVIWVKDPTLRASGERIASGTITPESQGTCVDSLDAFLAAMRAPDTIAFVDLGALAELSQVEEGLRPKNVVAIATESLAAAIGLLAPYPWLSHVISATMLEHPLVTEHLQNLFESLMDRKPRLLDWLGPEVSGRRVRLTHASKRAARLDRMADYLESNGVSDRTIDVLRNATEELMTNAFYDAPVAAGAIDGPISRTLDVELPDEFACDLAYGCRDDLAIVRVKDPFGSLSRDRLVEVLTRCAQTGMSVEVDESMGGAGLGMWRIFSNATFVAISVAENRHTEILVGISKRVPGVRPFAFHLFFGKGGHPRSWSLAEPVEATALSNSMLFALKSN